MAAHIAHLLSLVNDSVSPPATNSPVMAPVTTLKPTEEGDVGDGNPQLSAVTKGRKPAPALSEEFLELDDLDEPVAPKRKPTSKAAAMKSTGKKGATNAGVKKPKRTPKPDISELDKRINRELSQATGPRVGGKNKMLLKSYQQTKGTATPISAHNALTKEFWDDKTVPPLGARIPTNTYTYDPVTIKKTNMEAKAIAEMLDAERAATNASAAEPDEDPNIRTVDLRKIKFISVTPNIRMVPIAKIIDYPDQYPNVKIIFDGERPVEAKVEKLDDEQYKARLADSIKRAKAKLKTNRSIPRKGKKLHKTTTGRVEKARATRRG